MVPLFHANAWSLAFSAPMAGAELVLPGAKLDGASIYELLEAEQVTSRPACRPSGSMLLQHIEATGGKLSTPEARRDRRLGLPARDDAGFEAKYGVKVLHAWGMTEMSPLGTICSIKPRRGGLAGRRAGSISSEAGPSRRSASR